ncbi:MAG: YggT family protein [Sphingomonas sp.]|uniref:YggT family protein n=1 Tax=Sphingomonas sp. TaxID=28214 RepID=UPI003F7D2806
MLIGILQMLLDVASFIIIAQFVLSILIAFNVVSRHTELVDSLWRGLSIVTDPIYRPIRRILPDTGAIDFSPMVVLIIIRILRLFVLPWLFGLIVYGS